MDSEFIDVPVNRYDPVIKEMCHFNGHQESNSWPGECVCGEIDAATSKKDQPRSLFHRFIMLLKYISWGTL